MADLSIWAAWPTVHVEQSKKMVAKWKALGYKTAVLVNPPLGFDCGIGADRILVQSKWCGFPAAANQLCHNLPADIVVLVGDDVYPDTTRNAQHIGKEFVKRFPDLFGVMQPTGDDFASTSICAVSPWIGRAFIEKAYGGKGPFCEEYFHYYSDHELQIVASRMKAFEQRPDLVQFHDHWQRRGEQRPPHLKPALKMWHKDKGTFTRRESNGFPNAQMIYPKVGLPETQAQKAAWKTFVNHGTERESSSGYGSSIDNTKEIRAALPGIFTACDVEVFTDIPCGDWNWMRLVDLDGIDYLGGDIVPELIEQNRKRYPWAKFVVTDIVRDAVRKSDLILCRDLLFHLSNEWVMEALKNIRNSGTPWLLSTSFPSIKVNEDLDMRARGVGWRAINLCEPPFSLPQPTEIIQENYSHACKGRIVGLFDMRKW